MWRNLCGLAAWGLLAVGIIGPARADVALNFNAVTGGFSDGVPRVIGWEFTVGSQAISVNQLGVFDFGQEPLLTSHDVAIYNYQTELPVVTATVPSGTSAALSGLFRYVSVSPTILPANTSYVIAASWIQNGDPFVWSPSIGTPSADIIGLSVDPAITLGIASTGLPASGRFLDTTSTLQFPTKRLADAFPGDPRVVLVGPNFTFSAVSAVPEPSSLVMSSLILALVGGTAIVKRRRRP
jgi:hypothetical protein